MAQQLKITESVVGEDYISAMTLYIVTNGAAELLLRASESMALRKGCVFRHEQKQMYKNLMEATHKVMYYYNQLTEYGTGTTIYKEPNAADIFDNQLYDSNLIVVLLMRMFNAIDGDRQEQIKLIQQLQSMEKGNKTFADSLINKFENRLKLMNHETEATTQND